MKRLSICLLFLVLTITSAAADGDVWSAATTAYGRGLLYEPGHTILRIEELDPDGTVQSSESGEIRTHRADGRLVSTVIMAQKNGKDVTADWQKRYNRSDSGDRGGPPAGFDATPFDPGWAAALSLGPPRRNAEGLLIPYTIKRDGVQLEGTATFGNDGQARSASQNWLRLPPLVTSMSSTINYRVLDLPAGGDRAAAGTASGDRAATGGDRVATGGDRVATGGDRAAAGDRATTGRDRALVAGSMQIEGVASILFVKKRFRMSFEFGQWRPKPPGS